MPQRRVLRCSAWAWPSSFSSSFHSLLVGPLFAGLLLSDSIYTVSSKCVSQSTPSNGSNCGKASITASG